MTKKRNYDPTVDVGRMHGPAKWTDAEYRTLLDTADNATGTFTRRDGGPDKKEVSRAAWWRCYFRLARETGLPASRLFRIRCGDITPSGVLTATAPAFGRKAAELKAYPLTRSTTRAVRALRTNRRCRLLAIRNDYDSILRCFRNIVKAAGLRTGHVTTGDIPYRVVMANGMRQPQRIAAMAVRPKLDEEFGSDSLLAEFFEGCYAPRRLGNRSGKTIRLYHFSIRKLSGYLGRDATLADLNDDTLVQALTWMGQQGLSPYTVEKERAQLCAIWTFAAKRGLVAKFPTVPPGRLPERKPTGWMIGDLGKIFAAIRKMPSFVGRAPQPIWWTALLSVLYDTGERISATMRLTWSNFDLDQGWLTIPAEYRKFQTRDIVARLHPDTVEAVRGLLPFRGKNDVQVFVWPYSETYLWNRYRRILKAAGLPHDSRSMFHRIRRTTASYFERHGGNATELLDHSSRKVTRKYLDARIVERQHASDLLPRPGADAAVHG